MNLYHKINAPFFRDGQHKLMEGTFSTPEIGFLADTPWVWTEKVDGTNIRLYWTQKADGGFTLTVGGRTERAEIPTSLLGAINNLELGKKLKEHFPDTRVMLIGEGYGAKIQKGGGNYRSNQSFVLFDVMIFGDNYPDGLYLTRSSVNDIAQKLGIDSVPVVGIASLQWAIDIVSSGLKSTWGGFYAEGLVGVPKVDLYSRMGNRVITKVKHKDFFGK